MTHYVPLIREFAARDELFHDAVARRLGLHPTDEKVLRLLGQQTVSAGDLADSDDTNLHIFLEAKVYI